MSGPDRGGFFARLRSGLQKSSSKIAEGISTVFTKRPLDETALLQLEDLLIGADLGPRTAERLVTDFAQNRFGATVTDREVKVALAGQIAALLQPCAVPLVIDRTRRPFVVLVAGVNGVGKTTTIGKMASFYRDQHLKVFMAAGDTFRAAAVNQLKIWGERTGAPVIAGEENADSASVAFHALETARQSQADLLLIDTAGRLHNKGDLMQELAKLVRVLKKIDPSAPHATILVLDATTGQNAHAQVEVFKDLTQITGLVVTKLDGSAKAGVLVSLAEFFRLPIHAVGVGEGVHDLQPFDPKEYADALVGLEPG